MKNLAVTLFALALAPAASAASPLVVHHPSADFAGTGRSALIWQNTNGAAALWLMNGTTQTSAVQFGPYTGWSVLSGDADFNADGKSDLLWTHTNGAAAVWLMNGTTQVSAASFGPYPGWSVVSGNHDFNGDGKSDLLWKNTDGSVAIWLMDGTTVLSQASFGPYTGWSIVSGDNDFNGDGKSDLLWKNSNGAAALWLMDGTTQTSATQFGPYTGWSILSGSSDFNGDGKTDLLWQNSNGAAALWLMNGLTQTSATQFGPYTGWTVVPGRRDFNGDGKSDLLWTNTNGAAAVWLMNGLTQTSAASFGPFTGWSITGGMGDYNGDGMTDLLWSNSDGSAAVWLMNGTAQLSAASFGPYSGWSIMTGTSGASSTDGACGSSDGAMLSAAPTTGLCRAGTATPVSGTGPWTWSCDGAGGGSTAACSATIANESYSGCAAPTTPKHIYYSDPVNGSMANDGTQAHPWGSLSAMVAAGKLPPAAGSTVVSGDQIILLSGDHGSLSLNNAANSDFISIQAARGQTPVLSGITIYGGSHWAFSGLTIQSLNNGGYVFGVRYTGDNFIFTNGTILSQPDVSTWTQADWRQKALYYGVNADGNCVAITNNTIRNVAFAVGVSGSDVLVRGNTIDHFGDDGIDFGQGTGTGTISNIELSHNIITNNLNIGDNNHNDGIQGWVLNGTTGTNVLIDSNQVIAQTDPALPWTVSMQGISEFDGAWDGIRITNNVVIAAAYHGIALYGAHNSTIINNTVFGNFVATNGDVNETWIGVFDDGGSPPVNVVVRNNISGLYSLAGTGVTADHNVLTTNPQTNFVQFNRATFQYDLHPAPGSVELGYGSTQLAPAYDITGAQRVPPITAGAYQ